MKKYIKLTLFFVKESYSYIKPWKFKDVLRYPMAYYKFMKLST